MSAPDVHRRTDTRAAMPGPRVPAPPVPWLLRWPGLVLAAVVVAAYRGSEGDLSALFGADGRRAMGEFARGLWPPELGEEFLRSIARPVGETVAIAVVGLSLALLLAAPLTYLAASPEIFVAPSDRPGWARRAAYRGARILLNLMRSIPEMIWALIFVRAMGLGPLPGVLALGVGYGGVLAKVFAEIIESVPRDAAQTLAAAGAQPFRAFVFGTLPPALPLLSSYTLYRLDCALRASTILGMVGAGGLGQHIELSMRMFAYGEVGTLVLVLVALVASVDAVSQRVRRRLHTGAFLPHSRAGLAVRTGLAAGWFAAVAASAAFLGLVADFAPVEAGRSLLRFAAELFPPDLSPAFVEQLLPRAAETLATSVLGTVVAAAVGLLLAYPASHRLFVAPDPGEAGRRSAAAAWARRCAHAAARGVLNLGRTLPEMLWAMVLILAVGLGPFAGALAMGVHTAGVLGRLYAEALEEVRPGPLRSLREGGGGRLAALVLGALPQAWPQIVAYTLYRWEVNIRASAVLGIVGAGGLGQSLHISLSLFHNHRTLTLILVLLTLVTAVDAASAALRSRLASAKGARASARAEPRGTVQVVIEGTAYLVLDLSPRGARLFARPGELTFPPGGVVPVHLDLGLGRRVPCRARLAWRTDERAGSFAGLAFEGIRLVDRWRLRQAVAPRPARPFAGALRGTLEAR